MKHLEMDQVESDLDKRFKFLREFIGFSDDDVRTIQASAAVIGPQVSSIVEETYAKLLSYDATAIHFVAQQHGCPVTPPVSLDELSEDHPQIKFRKDHLNRYLVSLFSRNFDKKMVLYLDMVGKIHTNKAGNSQIQIPQLQMNALMGLISDLLTETILDSNLADETKLKTIRAYQKLLWIQNDYINRHYANPREVNSH